MSLLDAFLGLAVPFVLVTLVVVGVVQRYHRSRGIYTGEEGAGRRDEVNRKYRTNTGAVVIALVFVCIWGVIVAALVSEWGAILFTFVIAALLLLPVGTVAMCVIALYMFAVHAIAKARDG